MNTIKELISNKDWNSLISSYSVQELRSSLSFKEAMLVVEPLFYDDIQDDERQQYALKLAFEIKDHFKEWDRDWKDDVFLGELCEMLWLYDERYFYYKKAYDKLEDPPAKLLLLLSACNSTPGIPPITTEESEFYLKKALDKKLTADIALAMKSLYKRKDNKSQENYWDQMYKKLSKEEVYTEQLIPDVLRDD